MNIVTKRPVITETKELYDLDASDNYYNAGGNSGNAQIDELFQGDPSDYYYNNEGSTTTSGGQGRGGMVWDKVKKAWTWAKEKGVIDKAKDFLLKGRGQAQTSTNQAPVIISSSPPPPPGMSQTTKTLLIVGGVVGVAVIVYLIARNKGK